MKTTIIYTLVMGILLIGSWACKNDKEITEEVKSAVIQVSENCDFKKDMLQSYKINNSKAIADISRYDTYYKDLKGSLPSTDSDHLIMGVSVAKEELYQLLCMMRSQPGDSLYIMNAIKNVDSAGVVTQVTDMIFVVEHNPELGAPITSAPNSFFDFTQPCPAACPTLPGIDFVQ